LQTPSLDDLANAEIPVGHQRVEIGATPTQRVQAIHHVVGNLDVHGAQLERESLAVVGGGEKAGDANDLSRVAALAKVEQACERVRRSLRGCAAARLRAIVNRNRPETETVDLRRPR
jgi:hypothetical protein